MDNQCDGDLARVSFSEHVLPLYSSKVLSQECKDFFINYVADENDFAVGETQGVKTFTPRSLQDAIAEAALSKQRVGLYTDSMHVVATHIDSACKGKIDEEQRRAVVRFFGVLIQDCAMNAIKHNSNDDGLTIADCLTKHKFTQVDSKSGQAIGLPRARARLLDYLIKYNVDFSNVGWTSPQEATIYIIATLRAIYESNMTSIELSRKAFKNLPTMNQEFIDYRGKFSECDLDSSTFSVLLREVVQSV